MITQPARVSREKPGGSSGRHPGFPRFLRVTQHPYQEGKMRYILTHCCNCLHHPDFVRIACVLNQVSGKARKALPFFIIWLCLQLSTSAAELSGKRISLLIQDLSCYIQAIRRYCRRSHRSTG